MLRIINILQLQLFHYVFAFEVMKERAEEAEKQADAFAKMLTKVLEEATVLEESLNLLTKDFDNDENPGGSQQPPRALNEGSGGGAGD